MVYIPYNEYEDFIKYKENNIKNINELEILPESNEDVSNNELPKKDTNIKVNNKKNTNKLEILPQSSQYESNNELLQKNTNIVEKNVNEEITENNNDNLLSIRDIIEKIPRKYQNTALQILSFIKNWGQDIISWDNKGQISINKTIHPKSNITKSLILFLKPNLKTKETKFSKKFKIALSEINLPKKLMKYQKNMKWFRLKK